MHHSHYMAIRIKTVCLSCAKITVSKIASYVCKTCSWLKEKMIARSYQNRNDLIIGKVKRRYKIEREREREREKERERDCDITNTKESIACLSKPTAKLWVKESTGGIVH